jgi:hypothetical protein
MSEWKYVYGVDQRKRKNQALGYWRKIAIRASVSVLPHIPHINVSGG